MALVLNDRVLEQSSTAGTGTVSLSGAVAGYKSFANGIGDGQTCYYTIYDPTAFTWEVGIGTYTLSGSTLSRTTVLSNSLNTTALISFAANAKNVFVTYPASKGVFLDSTLGNDAVINTVRVGLGGGSVSSNTAVGLNALVANTSGARNTANGYQALNANTNSSSITAVGYRAGASFNNLNTSTYGDVFIGDSAGVTTSTAKDSTYVGALAGQFNAAGHFNTAVGAAALRNNTAASNAAFGASALFSNTTGANNVAVGYQAGYFNLTGNNNSFVGGYDNLTYPVGYYNVSGSANTAVGNGSLVYNTTTSNLVAVGYQSLRANTTNVATLGTITGGTLYTTGTYTGVVMTLSSGSTAITYPTATIVVAGGAVTTVTITSAGVGFKDTTTVLTAPAASIGGTGSGFSVPVATLQSGTGNTAIGYQALLNNIVGSSSTAIGYQAALNNSSGTTAVGYRAVATATNGNNTGIGYSALTTATGAGNTAIGVSSGSQITSGANNVVIGSYTGAAAPISATGSNFIVLSDGAGNVRQTIDASGITSLGGLPGAESLRVTPVASAVNYLQTTGSATGAAVALTAQGSDTNIDLTITPKGTGATYSPNFAASNGLVMNNATINTSYTLPTGYNAMSVGPVTVASGVTVTVPSGSVWAII